MRPFRASVWGCALAVVAASAGSTQAAWNNVFEACCWGCQRKEATANYPPPSPCAQPCQPQCTTRYEQRCYYQPVTTYQQRSYYEPVTTYRTSYYYEPVTSYRYSCYYDPCTCQYQQVACPQTCYKLKSQCCPVTSYLQRCYYQPVCSYQQAFYYEPVTTCCQTTVGAPVTTLPPGASVTPAPQGAAPPNVTAPPGVSEPGSLPPYTPPPNVSDGANTQTSESRRFNGSPNPGPAMPKALDQGRVVKSADNSPEGGARLLFVSAERQGAQQSVTADGDGRFQAALASGGWLVYVKDADGRPVFQEKVDVRDDGPRTMTLVSRAN